MWPLTSLCHIFRLCVTYPRKPISLEKDQARHGDQTHGSGQLTTVLHNAGIKYWLNESRVGGVREHDKEHNQFRALTFSLLLHLREKVSCLCNGKWRPLGQSSSECLTRTCSTLGMLGKNSADSAREGMERQRENVLGLREKEKQWEKTECWWSGQEYHRKNNTLGETGLVVTQFTFSYYGFEWVKRSPIVQMCHISNW